MKKTYLIVCITVILTLSMLSTSQAVVMYQNLSTVAPPSFMGSYTLMPFDTAPQAAIPNMTAVTTIPGSPVFGDLSLNIAITKIEMAGWGTWSHGYAGPVFYTLDQSRRLYLPPYTGAFFFYIQPDAGTYNVTATTDSGVSSGPVAVGSVAGATGFGFYTTEVDEYIAYIDINVEVGSDGFAIAEFGVALGPFACVGQVCYYHCFPGGCPPSHCDVNLSGDPFTIDVGQITYRSAFGVPPPSSCEVYVPTQPEVAIGF